MTIPINRNSNTVQVRGIAFNADNIKEAMLETGGIVVSDENLNMALDAAIRQHKAVKDGEPEMLLVEKEPGYYFVPRKVRLHMTRFDLEGRSSNIYLYFAVRRRYGGHAGMSG